MLNTLRDSANGIVAKVLMGLLVLSFAVWGIGDIFRSGGSNGTVATVGGIGISAQEYQRALHRKQEELRQMLGKNYTPDMVKKLGLQGQVISRLINNVLVEKETASLGIVVGDAAVVEAIRNNPNFKGAQGQFEKTLYFETLRNNGYSEQNYVADLRHDLGAKLLSDTLASGVVVPEDLVRALYKAREEQRAADIWVIPAEAVAAVPEPSEKELKAYYDAHEKMLLTPEVRSASYVELTLSDVQSKIQVSPEDIKHAYSDRAQDFHTPEQRTVEQMVFENEADAKAASEKLAQGGHFSEVANASSISNKGKLSLGTINKQGAPAEAAGAIFALKEGGVTAPISSGFGWHIFHVSRIEPESIAPLNDKTRADITRDLSVRQAQDTMYKLVTNLQDALAGGQSLEKAAAGMGQHVHAVGPMTREGLSPAGGKLTLPSENFAGTVFSTGEKEHSQAVQTANGSYIVLRVDSVMPEHARPLAEVKSQLVTAWKQEKRQALQQAASDDVSAKLQAGKKPSEVLVSRGVTASAISSGNLKRGSETANGKPLPRGLVLELFGLKTGQNTHAYGLQSGEMMMATLTQVMPAPALSAQEAATSKTMKAIREELRGTLAEEVLSSYLTYLRGKYRVSVNEAALSIKDDESSQ